MTPDTMAEEFERARYEQLRGQKWSDLREGEREARVEVARRALEDAGVTAAIAELRRRSEQLDETRVALAQRDAEIARNRAERADEVAALQADRASAVAALEAERDTAVSRLKTERDTTVSRLKTERDTTVAALEAERDAAVSRLEADLAAVRAELESSLDQGRQAAARADAAEAVIAAVRAALPRGVPAGEPGVDVAADAEPTIQAPAKRDHWLVEAEAAIAEAKAGNSPARETERTAPPPTKGRFARARLTLGTTGRS